MSSGVMFVSVERKYQSCAEATGLVPRFSIVRFLITTLPPGATADGLTLAGVRALLPNEPLCALTSYRNAYVARSVTCRTRDGNCCRTARTSTRLMYWPA